jgi:abortive infection bacteriophage resistance protein
LALVPFQKPALSLDQQLQLLSRRGLNIADSERAARYLENISYYRLSGYTRYFARQDDPKRQQFRDGVTLDNVIDLYVFDRRFRVLLSDALERIEVAVKGGLAYHGSVNEGPFWMTSPEHFSPGAHPAVLKMIRDECAPSHGRYKQVFLDAFYQKYSDELPPAWMITEVLSFGGASLIFKKMRGNIRVPVARQFRLQQDILESWLHALVFARNVCAHHSRLWNRIFTITPKIPREYRSAWPETSRNRVYITCAIVQHLLRELGGETNWNERLQALIKSRPDVPLSAMGFPDDWETHPFWRFQQ